MLEDPRFCTNEARMENLTLLERHLNDKLSAKTTEAWLDLLEQAGVPAGPINTILQMHDDPQALAREMVLTQSHPDAGPVRTLGLPVKFSQTPGGPKQPASRYAEHTRSILHDVGYTDEEISTLIQSGVTVANEQPPEKP
jgi:crotonobetainyl-CoA:carnitine CoA-transferase CaiB-like acyl-CoA transferase